MQLVAALCAYWRVHRHQALATQRPTRARRPKAAARRPRPATESPRRAGAGKFRWRMAAGGRCSGGGAGALAACRSRASRLGGLGWERRRRERAGRREGPTRPSDLRWERTRARLPWLGDVPRGSPARRPPQTPGGGTLQINPPRPRPRRPLPLAPGGGARPHAAAPPPLRARTPGPPSPLPSPDPAPRGQGKTYIPVVLHPKASPPPLHSAPRPRWRREAQALPSGPQHGL